MTTHATRRTARASTFALRAVWLAAALAAFAPGLVAQTATSKPTGTIEVGPSAVSDDSYKAGEYNGLQKKGPYGIGNVDLRGGRAGFNTDSTIRWRVKGTDLGLETRNIFADIASQGKFRLNVTYDELRRNRSDTYQTPYDGTGSNVLTLPSTWLVPTVAGSSGSSTAVNSASARGLVAPIGTAAYINTATNSPLMGALLSPTTTQISQVLSAANADVPLFHNVDLFTKRTKVAAGFSYNLDPRWAIDASFRPEHKSGLKPMGTVSRSNGSDISTIVPDVIDSDHDQVNVNLNFKGDRSFAQAGYYASTFRNQIPSISWQNWATPTGVVNTMSSAPGNTFNQLNVTGGLTIRTGTKLVANGSYARTTQNDPFLTDLTTPVVPVSSLNGLVVTTAFDAKLTTKPAKKLSLVAAYKFDNRDNRTAVHIYQYADAGEAPVANTNFLAGATNPLGPVLAQNANANRPYSRKVNLFNGEADYSVLKGQWIKAGYDFEQIDRACNGAWINCADAPTTREHTGRAEWRTNVSEAVTARLGYAYSVRRAPNYDENAFLALVPYANVAPAAAAGGATALSFMLGNGWTGWGPAGGYTTTTGNLNLFFPNNNALANSMYANNNRISELPGMRRYYVADRNRDKVRASLSWQALESLSLQGGVDLNNDTYPSSTYGVQDARNWAVNLDGSYSLADDMSVNVFYTFENQRSTTAGNSYTANSNAAALANGQPGAVGLSGNSCDSFATLQQRNNNNKLDPCLDWTSGMTDQVNSLGFGLRKQAGSLDLVGNVVLSRARWDNTVIGGNWANNVVNGPGATPTTVAAFFIAATPVPTITTDTAELRLTGTYPVGRGQSLRVGYSYLRMRSDDPAYEGMQFGSVSGVLPTNEQAFNYSLSVFGVSYVMKF